MVKYLHEFLVSDSALISPISQQGIKDEKTTLNNRKNQATIELI
jgi:hypothetical protein